MPATNQTSHFALNQWIGEDKPKMADFNQDNRRIDSAIADHAASQALHLSEEERARWNSAVPVMGTYIGDGAKSRVIDLGFSPRFGMVFAIDRLIIQSLGTSSDMYVYSAFLSADGCTLGAYIEPNGIYVISNMQAVGGRIARLNDSGVMYAYMVYPDLQ